MWKAGRGDVGQKECSVGSLLGNSGTSCYILCKVRKEQFESVKKEWWLYSFSCLCFSEVQGGFSIS